MCHGGLVVRAWGYKPQGFGFEPPSPYMPRGMPCGHVHVVGCPMVFWWLQFLERGHLQ